MYLFIKRFCDILFSLVLFVILSPVFLITSLLVKLTSKGPIFFKQTRSGKNNENFSMYKFRSMHEDNDVLNFSEEDKYTKIGKIIRRLSIDELPQLINILKGEMSFIGPRPWIVECQKYFTNIQLKRLDVLPGITGLAQSKGRMSIDIFSRIDYDLEYVDKISLFTDLKIIFLTIKTIFIKSHVESSKSDVKKEIDDLKENYLTTHKYHMPTKKILFTATEDSFITHFLIPHLKLFKDNGYIVHVATNGDKEFDYCDKKHIVSFERSPYKINNYKAYKSLKTIINEEKYDIIHTHTPMGGVVTRFASMKARKKGTRIMYTAHGFHFFKGAPKFNWLFFYPIEKFLANFTDDLLTMNTEDYDFVKDRFNTNVYYVPGVGINKERFSYNMDKTEKKEIRKSLGFKGNDFLAIYTAELSTRKNQKWLIETMKDIVLKNNKVHLLLAGKDSLNGELQILAKNLGIDKNIHFLGYRTDIEKIFKISDIAVSSSTQEGLPVNLMEAMACPMPIIATDCRGNNDLIKNGKNGYLIKQGDSKNFQKKFIKIIKKKPLSFKNNCTNMVEKYTVEKVLNEMIKIYTLPTYQSVALAKKTRI